MSSTSYPQSVEEGEGEILREGVDVTALSPLREKKAPVDHREREELERDVEDGVIRPRLQGPEEAEAVLDVLDHVDAEQQVERDRGVLGEEVGEAELQARRLAPEAELVRLRRDLVAREGRAGHPLPQPGEDAARAAPDLAHALGAEPVALEQRVDPRGLQGRVLLVPARVRGEVRAVAVAVADLHA